MEKFPHIGKVFAKLGQNFTIFSKNQKLYQLPGVGLIAMYRSLYNTYLFNPNRIFTGYWRYLSVHDFEPGFFAASRKDVSDNVRAHHMFSRILKFLFVIGFLRKKLSLC